MLITSVKNSGSRGASGQFRGEQGIPAEGGRAIEEMCWEEDEDCKVDGDRWLGIADVKEVSAGPEFSAISFPAGGEMENVGR